MSSMPGPQRACVTSSAAALPQRGDPHSRAGPARQHDETNEAKRHWGSSLRELSPALTATHAEIKARANSFALRWAGETRERAEKDSFWTEFLAIFGIDRRRVGVFEFLAKRQSTGGRGFVDLLIPGELAVEHKSAGESLQAAMEQLVDYTGSLKDHELPHTLVACNFAGFLVRDLVQGSEFSFELEDLGKNIDYFKFLAGYQPTVNGESEEQANLRATKLLSDLHDALLHDEYEGHPLRIFMTRILYILFADDTGVWDQRNLFQDYLQVKTREDGSDVGARVSELFAVLDTPEEKRASNLDEDLKQFKYINGGLFSENIRPPAFNVQMRESLLKACSFAWSRISPAIFGSLFQNVMEPPERRALGAHYTSERDILRTIRPLFLDQLEVDLEDAKKPSSRPEKLRRLRAFRDRLASLTFFDPACGCGNFLIIAYRELRRLELDALVAIRDVEASASERQRRREGLGGEGQGALDATIESKVHVGQFFGIEIEEFPARIAETAMHLADHQANLALSEKLGLYYVRLPITTSAAVQVANALRSDWASLLPASRCTYLFGNPPFSGQYNRSQEQTEDLKAVWGDNYYGYLDYVSGWYAKAIDYVGQERTRVAFVSTNSVCQGESVPHLWEPLLAAGFSIDFAHRPFLWVSEATGRAGVHVVIVGWSNDTSERKRKLYEYSEAGTGDPVLKMVERINPYLVPAPDVFVRPRTHGLAEDLPRLTNGNKPADGGFLMVSPDDYESVTADPVAAKYVRPFIGARELLYGSDRWCLWLTDLRADDLKRSILLRERLEGVKDFRARSTKKLTRDGAETPRLFQQIRQPGSDYLAIPRHVGQARRFFPVQRFPRDVIVGDHNFVAEDPDGYIFALLSSSMFISWMKGIAGRLRADPRFSGTGVWNTFPLPDVPAESKSKVIEAGAQVLDVRSRLEQSLDDLYDPDSMSSDLLKAHRDLDRLVDRLFLPPKSKGPHDNAERLAVLFSRYSELTTAPR